MRYTTPEQRIRAMTDQLATELLRFWNDDWEDVLALPPEALRRLAADYLVHRDYYLASIPDLPANKVMTEPPVGPRRRSSGRARA